MENLENIFLENYVKCVDIYKNWLDEYGYLPFTFDDDELLKAVDLLNQRTTQNTHVNDIVSNEYFEDYQDFPDTTTESEISNNETLYEHSPVNVKDVYNFQSIACTPSLSQSNYNFHATPTYFPTSGANKLNISLGIFLYDKTQPNRLKTMHDRIKLKLNIYKYEQRVPKKNKNAIKLDIFELTEVNMKYGEAIFKIKNSGNVGYYFLECSVVLPKDPNEEELKMKDFKFRFSIFFYKTFEKVNENHHIAKNLNDRDSNKSPKYEPSENFHTLYVNNEGVDSRLDIIIADSQESGQSREKVNNLCENLINSIKNSPDNTQKTKIKKLDPKNRNLADIYIQSAIGSIFQGYFGKAEEEFNTGLNYCEYTPEDMFKVGYFKSTIYRIQKNQTAATFHMNICTYLLNKCKLSFLDIAQYHFNLGALYYEKQKTTKTVTMNQVKVQFETSSKYYLSDFTKSSNHNKNARSVNGYFRSNVRLAQTLLEEKHITKNILEESDLFLKKVDGIEKKSILNRTRIHYLFTQSDYMRENFKYLLSGNKKKLNHQYFDDCVSKLNESTKLAKECGFHNEVRYNQVRFQMLQDLVRKNELNYQMGYSLDSIIIINKDQFDGGNFAENGDDDVDDDVELIPNHKHIKYYY